MRFRAFASILIVTAWSWSLPAQAQLTIEVTQGVAGGIPVAVVPFQTSGTPPQVVSDIVEADLQRSGRFDPLPHGDFLGSPSKASEVQFKDWRLIKSEALVVGKVQPVGADQYMVQFELFDVFRGTRLGGRRWPVVPGRLLRKVAHQVSDIVYQQLLGVRGAFDTRIGYVTEDKDSSGKRRFLLVVADSDGYGPQVAFNSKEPILSPAWSPDGTQLAYVSFERRHAEVWVQRIVDGHRRKLASYPGLNSAPAWSPDGRQLALTLSKDGNPEIYVMNLDSGALRRITHHSAIDTEPAWSPDGQSLVFTSDRSGTAQIYRVGVAGGHPERLTFNGRQNLRASYAPDGRNLALVTNQNGSYRIGLFDMNNRSLKVLTDGRLDESPSFAPNGSMILYATQAGGAGVLAAVSSDGRVKQLLKFQKGAVREPAWSPFNRQF